MSLRSRIKASLDDELFGIVSVVGQLAESCGIWAKENTPSMKLGKSACSIFQGLIYAPGIFNEPSLFRFIDLAEMENCSATTARKALSQLEAFGLADQWRWANQNKLTLTVPDNDLIEAHDERMKRVWEMKPGRGSRLTFRQAFPLWTEFTASFVVRTS